MNNIRSALKRKLSMHDKNTNFDEINDPDDFDDETHRHLTKEVDKAEDGEHPQGKPGSFLNKLIMHGNKKTEEQLQQGTTSGTSK